MYSHALAASYRPLLSARVCFNERIASDLNFSIAVMLQSISDLVIKCTVTYFRVLRREIDFYKCTQKK